MDAGLLATIMLIAGLFLIALELMIPSFGIIGISATVCLVISLWSAGQAWWGTAPGFFWTFTVLLIVGIPGVMGGMLFLLQSTALGKRVILQAQRKESLAPLTKVRDELAALIGERGKSASLLSPGGMVEVAGRRYHAESVGMMVDADTPIVVVKTRGTRVVVRPLSDSEIAEAVKTSEKEKTESSESTAAAFLPDDLDPEDQQDKPTELTDKAPKKHQESPNQLADTVANSEESEEDILDFQIPE